MNFLLYWRYGYGCAYALIEERSLQEHHKYIHVALCAHGAETCPHDTEAIVSAGEVRKGRKGKGGKVVWFHRKGLW